MNNTVHIKSKTDSHLVVAGWGVVFEGEDVVGDTFTKDTDFMMDLVPVKLIFYDHTFSEVQHTIGKALLAETRSSDTIAGIWVEAQLDLHRAYVEEIEELIEKGALGWSSGSVSHLVRYVGGGWQGKIKQWPIVEFSLTPTPAEPRTIGVESIKHLKSIYKQAGMTLPEGLDYKPEASARGAAARDRKKTTTKTKRYKMTDELTERDLEDAKAEGRKELEVEIQAEADHQAELKQAADDAVKAAKETWDEDKKEADEKAAEEAKKNRRLHDGANIVDKDVYAAKFANTWKYDELDIGAHALLVNLLNTTYRQGQSREPASEDATKALAIKIMEDKEKPRDHIRTKMAMKSVGFPLDAVKANELNQSTLASFGDEWVVTANSSDLWEKIRLGVQIVAKIPSVVVPQGAESVLIPLQSTSPTFYKVAQASAQDSNPGPITRTVTTSKLGTDNQTLTVAKMGAATYYTGELVEDSIVPWVSELRNDMVTEGAEVLEHVVIDGDTETGATTNINDIAGTPGSTDVFLLFNGFRKLALVTNTANSRDGGALAVEDFLETVKLMGIAGKNAVQKDKVAFILDLWTHWKSLELAKIQSKDVFSAPTIEGANLTGIFGFDVFQSANMHRANQDATYGLKANTAGKVDLDTPANNTKGAILAVRWDQWRMGFKRLMTLETTRVPSADSTELVALMRVGLLERDNDASAISYNIGV